MSMILSENFLAFNRYTHELLPLIVQVWHTYPFYTRYAHLVKEKSHE